MDGETYSIVLKSNHGDQCSLETLKSLLICICQLTTKNLSYQNFTFWVQQNDFDVNLDEKIYTIVNVTISNVND